MKFAKHPLGTILPMLFLLGLYSCQKDNSFPAPAPETQELRVSGVIADDPEVLKRIPVIVSKDFLAYVKNTPAIMANSRPPKPKGGNDTSPPVVSILSPTANSTVSGSVSVQVTASDNVGVTSVSFSVDGTVIQTKTSAPFDFSWNSATVGNGSHNLSVLAKDAAGNTRSAVITIYTSNTAPADITRPVVTITSPSEGSSVTGTINISSNATDNVGVTSVSYLVDGTSIGVIASAPYTLSWNASSVSNGAHNITAVARDAAGNEASHTIQVTVNTIVVPPTSIPSSYQLIMPPVRNQGSEGSCVSFAAVYAARSAEQYYTTNAQSYLDGINLFSPEYTFNQVNLGGSCTSSSVVPTLDVLKAQGVCTWQTMPYWSENGCSIMPNTGQVAEASNFKIQSYYTVIAQDQNAIKSLIANKHPIIATINIDQQFYNAYPGYIWNSFTSNAGYHAITLCGYDDSKHAYKAINSWGTGWGESGYIWIDYDFFGTVSSYYCFSLGL